MKHTKTMSWKYGTEIISPFKGHNLPKIGLDYSSNMQLRKLFSFQNNLAYCLHMEMNWFGIRMFFYVTMLSNVAILVPLLLVIQSGELSW